MKPYLSLIALLALLAIAHEWLATQLQSSQIMASLLSPGGASSLWMPVLYLLLRLFLLLLAPSFLVCSLLALAHPFWQKPPQGSDP